MDNVIRLSTENDVNFFQVVNVLKLDFRLSWSNIIFITAKVVNSFGV